MLPSIFSENLFDDFFNSAMFPKAEHELYGKHAKNLMNTDVREVENGYEIDMNLPGFKKDEVEIQLQDGCLTVSAAKGLDKDEEDKKGRYIRQERYAGSLSRSFYVGEDVEPQDVKAKYESGVLTVLIPKKEPKKIVSGREHRVDVGRLGDKYFINAADFGAFTWLPYTTPQRLKNKMGFYAYVLDGIKDLAKLQSEHLRITINDQTQEGEFVFGVVASSSALAGALDFFGQKVVADDGLFEVLLIRRPNSPAELQSTIAALREQNLNNELISFCRTDRIEVECMKKLAWALDGEKCVGGSRHALEMLPRRVRIVY